MRAIESGIYVRFPGALREERRSMGTVGHPKKGGLGLREEHDDETKNGAKNERCRKCVVVLLFLTLLTFFKNVVNCIFDFL